MEAKKKEKRKFWYLQCLIQWKLDNESLLKYFVESLRTFLTTSNLVLHTRLLPKARRIHEWWFSKDTFLLSFKFAVIKAWSCGQNMSEFKAWDWGHQKKDWRWSCCDIFFFSDYLYPFNFHRITQNISVLSNIFLVDVFCHTLSLFTHFKVGKLKQSMIFFVQIQEGN